VPTYTRIFYVYVFVALVVLAAYRLKISSRGRALLAVRENEIAAEAVGIPTSRVKVQAFVMSAFFAGIGGALFAHELGTTLNPRELGFQKSIDLVIMVVIGGMGSITGVVVAAVILTIMPELFREFADYRMPVYALALIVVMILRPQGLFGIKELWDTKLWKRYVHRRRNGTPRGVKNCNEGGCPRCNGFSESGKNLEECLCSHGEENAIVQASYHGISIKDSTLYSTYSPCLMCSKKDTNTIPGC